jgi:hemerythrin-like metal-binding protein
MIEKQGGMVAIAWNEAYTVHVASIDKQHKKIMCLINDLNRVAGPDGDEERVAEALTKVVDCMRSHFDYEESYLERYRYPFLQVHRLEHAEFLRTVERMQRESVHISAPTRHRLLQFLVNWLKNHIIREDKPYIAFMLEHGVK